MLRAPGKDLSDALIFAVDDEPVNLLLLEDIIEERYQVKTFSSAAECLQQIKYESPDLILLDINMPGMNGFELCQQLKADSKTSEIPIVFLTAMLSSEDERKGLQLGAVDYITKPFTESILLARIETHLKLARTSKFLKQEHEYIEQIITAMRYDARFDQRHVKKIFSSVDKANGDISLSACNGVNQQHLMVGDFTGHGLTAAIAGPLVSSLFYSNIGLGRSSLEVLQSINHELFNKLPAQKFLAANYAKWDQANQKIYIYNFAMLPALLVKANGEIISVPSSSLPLGVVEELPLQMPAPLPFVEGDKLYLFTDGLVEAQNMAGEQFSLERLKDSISRMKQQDDGLEMLLDELSEFSEGVDFFDDITIVELSAESLENFELSGSLFDSTSG